MRRRWTLAGLAVALLAAGPSCQEEERVTGPTLSATCEARPSSGPAPLVVSFLLGVSGAEGPYSVAVTYGDGTEGTDPDAPHTYLAAGAFTAVFNVSTAKQGARCATAVTVQPSPSPSPDANQPPHAVFKSTPDAVRGEIKGKAPLSVRFNMCASTDPEGDRMFFRMDFDGDGDFDTGGTTGGHCRRDNVFAAGTWKARTCLHDIDADGEARHEDQCKTYTVVATP
jgi:hypothetical protein